MQEFATGAYRSDETGKLDYEACLSPAVLRRYAEYKRSHRKQADGKMRADDNWQQGMPLDRYMKSLCRHTVDAWGVHRGDWLTGTDDESLEELLCAIIFNAQGYLHGVLKRPVAPVAVKHRSRKGCKPQSHNRERCKWGVGFLDESSPCSICHHGDKREPKTPEPPVQKDCGNCKKGVLATTDEACVGCFGTEAHARWEPRTDG